MVVYVVRDLLFVSKIREAAEALGVAVQGVRDVETLPEVARGARLVIGDLAAPQALRALELLAAAPDTAAVPTVGFVGHERTDVMETARALGCGQVLAKGEFAQKVGGLLRAAAATGRARAGGPLGRRGRQAAGLASANHDTGCARPRGRRDSDRGTNHGDEPPPKAAQPPIDLERCIGLVVDAARRGEESPASGSAAAAGAPRGFAGWREAEDGVSRSTSDEGVAMAQTRPKDDRWLPPGARSAVRAEGGSPGTGTRRRCRDEAGGQRTVHHERDGGGGSAVGGLPSSPPAWRRRGTSRVVSPPSSTWKRWFARSIVK
jgi:hypothetical protein